MARKGKPTEEIIAALHESEVRIAQRETVSKICRGFGISDQPYCKWRREYGGLKIDQAKRLKELERENERPEKEVSELPLHKLILKEALTRKY
jgi:putative transposase